MRPPPTAGGAPVPGWPGTGTSGVGGCPGTRPSPPGQPGSSTFASDQLAAFSNLAICPTTIASGTSTAFDRTASTPS